MEICTLHEAVCTEAGWLSKQAGFCLVVRMEKNQPGSRDEIIYVIIKVGINEQAYCTFKNITCVYLCYNFTVTTTRCHVGFRKSKKKAGITQSSFSFSSNACVFEKNSSPGKGPACLYDILLVQLAEMLAAHHRDLSKQANLPITCDQARPPSYLLLSQVTPPIHTNATRF